MKHFIMALLTLVFALSSGPAFAALTQTEVSQLYVSIFGRASEGEGNAYWSSEQDNMTTAADTMLDTDAAKAYFGDTLNDNQMFIEFIYLNTLDKTIADDSAGIDYWVGELNKGNSRGQVVATLIGVIKDYAPGGLYYNPGDAATVAAYNQFTNRVTVSDYMADTVHFTPDGWKTATAFSSGLIVTDDPKTVDTAKLMLADMNGQAESEEKFLGVGNWWKFQLSTNETTIEGIRTVIGETNIFGVDGVAIIEMSVGSEISIGYQKMIAGTVYNYNNGHTSAIEDVYYDFLSGPIGTSWSVTESDDSIEQYEIVAIEDVQVPAGVFTGCYKVANAKINQSDGSVMSYDERWWHPGTGYVKLKMHIGLVDEEQIVLIEAGVVQ